MVQAKHRIFFGALLSLPIATGAYAATVTTSAEVGQAYVSHDGFDSDTSVYGNQMAGMLLTLNFADGTSDTVTWAQTDVWEGAASDTNVTMSSTWDNIDLYTDKLLSSFKLETGSSRVVFDILLPDPNDVPINTIGSGWGYPYKTNGVDTLTGNIDVTYSNAVHVDGQTYAPDIFTTMFVDYSGLSGGGLLGTTHFATDMDNLKTFGDLTAVQETEPVPLPADAALLLTGVACFEFLRRKRGTKNA